MVILLKDHPSTYRTQIYIPRLDSVIMLRANGAVPWDDYKESILAAHRLSQHSPKYFTATVWSWGCLR